MSARGDLQLLERCKVADKRWNMGRMSRLKMTQLQAREVRIGMPLWSLVDIPDPVEVPRCSHHAPQCERGEKCEIRANRVECLCGNMICHDVEDAKGPLGGFI